MHKQIRKLRKTLGLTQAEFGEKLGVSRDVISNIEYNRVPLKEHRIRLICKVFNVSEDWIKYDIGPMILADPNEKVDEAVVIFKELLPEFQDYAIEQIKGLLTLQDLCCQPRPNSAEKY